MRQYRLRKGGTHNFTLFGLCLRRFLLPFTRHVQLVEKEFAHNLVRFWEQEREAVYRQARFPVGAQERRFKARADAETSRFYLTRYRKRVALAA